MEPKAITIILAADADIEFESFIVQLSEEEIEVFLIKSLIIFIRSMVIHV
jgi:hypothetical protein